MKSDGIKPKEPVYEEDGSYDGEWTIGRSVECIRGALLHRARTFFEATAVYKRMVSPTEGWARAVVPAEGRLSECSRACGFPHVSE